MRHLLLSCSGFLCLFVSSLGHAQMVVAHRGASYDAPENTLAAFQTAWEQGADAIEGDFYVTKDQQIVCIHDKTTKRTAPGQSEKVVAESTLDQLRTLDVGSWKHSRYTGQMIPTLSEVLALVPAGKKIFVEIKCGTEILPLLQPQLRASGLQSDQIVIICFDEAVISGVRKTMPDYQANWLTSYKKDEGKNLWKPSRDQVLASLQRTQATGLGTNANADVVDGAFVESVCKDVQLHVWTVNEVPLALRFADLGAASITTDRPGLIRHALQESAAEKKADSTNLSK